MRNTENISTTKEIWSTITIMDGKGGLVCLNPIDTGIVILGVTAGGGGENDRSDSWTSGSCRLLDAAYCLGYMEKPMTCNCGHPENLQVCDRWDCPYLRKEMKPIRARSISELKRLQSLNSRKENLMRTLILGTALSLALGSAAYAQAVGQPAAGMPCVVTAVQPADATTGHNYNLFWCGPTLVFATPSSTYSNVANPEIFEAIAASIGHMVTADVSPLGFVSLIGTTGIAQYVNNVKVQ